MLLDALVPKPLSVSNISSSALFRTIEKYCPTLLIDEADTFLTNDEILRGIINSGHRRSAAFVIRTTGEDFEPQRFATWVPKVVAMIGSLPCTIEDRSIVIRMERKRSSEKKETVRLDRLHTLEELRRRAARWASDNIADLRAVDPTIPDEISNDRMRDNWRVLLSIADCVGGSFPAYARTVAVQLAGVEPASESPKTLLLADLKAIFEEKGSLLLSEEIISLLVEMGNRPWGEWRSGKPLSKVGLAKLLKGFGVVPQRWKEDGKSVRGYELSQFEDAFSRYLGLELDSSRHHSTPDLDSITYKENHSTPEVNGCRVENESKSGVEWCRVQWDI